jgi:L-malate glycosyltransferase
MINVLLVPGFVVDTYSQIEASYIELSAEKDPKVNFIWLVPSIKSRYNRFAYTGCAAFLDEPLYVKHLKEYGIPYIIGNISKYNIIKNYLLFRKIFKEYDIRAVYTHFGFERFYSAFFAKLSGRTTIWNEHWHSLGTKFVSVKKLFYRFFVDYFISVSSFITSTLPGRKNIFTIKNAMENCTAEKFSKEKVLELKNNLNIDANKKVVLLAAAFTNVKRHDLALQICKNVLLIRDDVLFIFLGQGSTQEKIKHQITALGLASNILMPGHVNNIDDYYRIADICMLTSIGEPFGYVVLEAFKYSLPLIAFNSGGPAEIIEDNYSGLLVSPENTDEFSLKLLKLLEDPCETKYLGGNALSTLNNEFSRSKWKKQLMNTFYEILKSNTDI